MKYGSGNVNVRRVRERLGFTQEEMSEKMGRCRTSYCNLEYGRVDIFSKPAREFMNAAGCSEAELVLGSEIPTNPDGTLMQETDFRQIRSALVSEYESRLEEAAKENERLRGQLSDRDRLIEAQEKTIRTQEQAIARLEKYLSKYDAG